MNNTRDHIKKLLLSKYLNQYVFQIILTRKEKLNNQFIVIQVQNLILEEKKI